MTADGSALSSLWLALRSLFWALLLPGFFAGYAPWRYFGLEAVRLDISRPAHFLGVVLIAFGAALLVMCIWEFARTGRGTLSPVDAPQRVVVEGLYRYVRNPMYLSVTTIVFGELLLTQSVELLVYWVVWFTAANLFVIGYEEPTLRRRFGASYESYTREVGRWVPRFPA
jgi:protein-S-isoprenylcysteine O-methyltransferase Ste14